MRELAVQSANDTNNASDRASLQAEVAQLTDELERIATTTSTSIVVREAAILFESGSHLTCDFVITVEADEAVRIERASARAAKRGEAVPSEEDIRARLKRQASREQRVAQSNFVLENGNGDALMPQVLETFERLMLRTRR